MSIPVVNPKQTGANIKKLRQGRGLTVADLQTVFGFASPQAIYKWQTGDSMPSLDNLVILSSILGVTMDQLVVVDSVAV